MRLLGVVNSHRYPLSCRVGKGHLWPNTRRTSSLGVMTNLGDRISILIRAEQVVRVDTEQILDPVKSISCT